MPHLNILYHHVIYSWSLWSIFEAMSQSAPRILGFRQSEIEPELSKTSFNIKTVIKLSLRLSPSFFVFWTTTKIYLPHSYISIHSNLALSEHSNPS